MTEVLWDSLVLSGLAIICWAIGWIYPPAGWITLGLVVTAIGLTMGRLDAQARRRKQRMKGRSSPR